MARVLFTCSSAPDYVRNQSIIRALRRRHQVDMVVSSAGSYPLRLGSVLPRALLARNGHDVCFAGFLGQPIVPFLGAGNGCPIILDAFISVYDTLCLDRRQFAPRSPVGRFARWLDASSMAASALVLSDTVQQADFMAREFDLPRAKFAPVPVGVNEEMFQPRPAQPHDGVRVLYYCSFLPLHGSDVVVEAANVLRDRRDITFTLIGRGPERERVQARAQRYGLGIKFIDWLPMGALPEHVAACDVFLGGHFSAGNEKATRVVPGKVFQALAMAKPAVVGDCPAIREWFEHGVSACIVPMGDAEALAAALGELAGSEELRRRIGQGGRELHERHFSEEAIATRLDGHIESVLASGSG